MDLKELFTEIGIEVNEELYEQLNSAVDKEIQSSNDRIRTEYTKKVKELEQYKPIEQSAEQIELANLKKELADTKFQKSLKDIGVDDEFAKYLSSDIDLTEFSEVYKGFAQTKKDFIPNKNMGDGGITKEQFKGMGISERTKLYETNPELYNQLSK